MALPAAQLLCLAALLAAGWRATAQSTATYCHTEDCVALGAILTQNTNLMADPCDNFYEFACGGFGRRFRYDVDELAGRAYTDASVHMTAEVENRLFEIMVDASQFIPENDTVRAAASLARAVYNNCVSWGEAKFADLSPTADTALRAAAVRNFNALLDHLLVTDSGAQLTSLEQLLARAVSMGFAPVFGLGAPEELVNQLPTDPSAPLFANVTKVSITVNTFNYTADASLWLSMLRILASRNVTLSDALFGYTEPNPEQAMKAVASQVTRIVEALQSSNISFQGNMEELNRELSGNTSRSFQWSLFIRALMPTPARVDPATIVSVDNLLLLKALLTYFKAESVYDMKSCSHKDPCKPRFSRRTAFLILDAMLELADLLPLSLKDTRPAKDSPLAALIVTKPRSHRRQCLEVAHKLMEPVVEWLYRRHYFPGTFATIERVISETKEAMIASMHEQNWISPQDKAKMADKVRTMRYYVGHRELSEDQVARFYRDTVARFNRTRAADLGYVLGLALRAYARRHLDLFLADSPAPFPFHWESPFIVNAYNDLESNNLVFPLGILTPPVYNPGYPDFALYGGLGSLVGHEIGHGFADQWFKSLEVGLLQLEPATEAGYMRRVQCVRDDFGTVGAAASLRPAADTGGNATLADDIADIVGLSAAHRAYLAARSDATDRSPGCALGANRTLNPEQMFFVHSAQVFCTKATPETLDELFRRDQSASHSPGPARVNGMARNSEQFARAFGCPVGSRMNPVSKCIFW